MTYVAEFRRTLVTVTTLVRRRPRRKATGMKVYSCNTAKDLDCFDHNRKVPPFLIDCLIVGQNTDTKPTNEWRGSASTKRRSFHPLDIAIVWRRGGRGRVEGRGEEGEGEGRGGEGRGTVSTSWVQQSVRELGLSYRVGKRSMKVARMDAEEIAWAKANLKHEVCFLMDEYNFPSTRVANLDGTALCVVPVTNRGSARKGATNVTFCHRPSSTNHDGCGGA